MVAAWNHDTWNLASSVIWKFQHSPTLTGPLEFSFDQIDVVYSRDIYVQGLSDFFETALRQKPYATQVRYMSHCDVLQPSGGNRHLSPTFTVPGTSRLSPTPPLISGVLIWLLSCVQTIEDALATLTLPPTPSTFLSSYNPSEFNITSRDHCAACSNTLTCLLSEVDGVSDVVVDLVGHSARVVVDSQKLTPTVVETIGDAGFVRFGSMNLLVSVWHILQHGTFN